VKNLPSILFILAVASLVFGSVAAYVLVGIGEHYNPGKNTLLNIVVSFGPVLAVSGGLFFLSRYIEKRQNLGADNE